MMKKPSLLLVFAALFALCGLPLPSAFAQMNPSIQMVLGNPDGASTNPAGNYTTPAAREKYLIQRSQYAMSFNDTLHFPNWVAWHLAAEDIGMSGRSNAFAPDPDLPTEFTKVMPSDYAGMADRGHNCPSGDRTKTLMDNEYTFYMTNMTPQDSALNTGPWERLETYCRSLVSADSRELMIYCGHGFGQGYTPTPPHNPVGPKSIPMPDFAWKIIVVVPKSTSPNTTDLLSRVTMRTRVIAVIMNNDTSVRGKSWTSFITTVSDIEAKTGLVFFDKVPTRTAAALKIKKDVGN